MDQQNNAPETQAVERRPMTPEEIARLERAAALGLTTPAAPSLAGEAPDQQASRTAPVNEAQRYAEPEIDDPDPEDDAPTEWVPSRFEKKIHAIPEKQWVLYQVIGGALIGIFTVIALFFGGAGLNVPFLIAIALALVGPNMLEDRGRRKLSKGRMVMVIVIAVGIVALFLYNGFTKGWNFVAEKTEEEAAETALRMLRTIRL